MADLCYYPYDLLINSIKVDDSDSTWITSLSLFCNANADAFSLPTQRKDNFLELLRLKLHSNVKDKAKCNFELCLQLCDCARIAARDKLDIDQLVCEEFVTDLFSIVTHPQSNISVMALRSLINLMNENTTSYKIFTGEPLNGINRLITLLRHLIFDNREPQVMFLSTKLLYMLQSQRADRVGPLLRASDAESCFLLQLGRCLSPERYDDLVSKLDIRIKNTEEAVTGVGPTIIPSMICEVQTSSNKCGSDDSAFISDVRIDQITIALNTCEIGSTAGLIRDGWGPLFMESCKLLYAMYGDECFIGDDYPIPPPNLAILSDLLADVILAPSYVEGVAVPPGFGDSVVQYSCRRHALQLAMLSLDLDTTAQKNCIIENIVVRSGIHVLCTLLNQGFSELETASRSDGTHLMQGSAFMSNSSSAVLLYPILSLLMKVSTFSAAATADLKLLIFPNPWKKGGEEGSKDEEEEADEDEMGPDYLQRKMDPTDIPEGTLRARLVRSMTSLDSLLKRYCAELLYALCDKDTGEFVSRTGFGNAIALMQIKGLI